MSHPPVIEDGLTLPEKLKRTPESLARVQARSQYRRDNKLAIRAARKAKRRAKDTAFKVAKAQRQSERQLAHNRMLVEHREKQVIRALKAMAVAD